MSYNFQESLFLKENDSIIIMMKSNNRETIHKKVPFSSIRTDGLFWVETIPDYFWKMAIVHVAVISTPELEN